MGHLKTKRCHIGVMVDYINGFLPRISVLLRRRQMRNAHREVDESEESSMDEIHLLKLYRYRDQWVR